MTSSIDCAFELADASSAGRERRMYSMKESTIESDRALNVNRRGIEISLATNILNPAMLDYQKHH